mgnify:CR=1 FL=1
MARLLCAFALLATGCAPSAPVPDDWIQQTWTISNWPLPEAQRARFSVEVNGVWVGRTPEEIAAEHRRGRPALVSVQGLAAEAELLEERPELVEALSRDVFGNISRVPWYDWLEEPVSTLSIAHPVFQDYLVEQGREAVAAGADGLFIDEIQTSALLVSLEEFGAGFAPVEVAAFLEASGHATFEDYAAVELGLTPEGGLPAFLASTDAAQANERAALYARYRAFQEEHAFAAMSAVVARIRADATAEGSSIAVGANLAGLGALTDWSPLTAPIWQDSMDFIVFEHDPPTLQAAFAPYYQLGKATLPGMVAAMPGLTLSDTLNAGGGHAGWLQMAYAEALAYEGNWAVSYWTEEMGWATNALLPEGLRASMRFVTDHKDLFDGARPPQAVGLRYPNAEVLADPSVHAAWVATAEALLAAHVPFDVLYSGDARFVATEPDVAPYALVLAPGDPVPADAPGAIETADLVFATSYLRDGQPGPVLHLVNRGYDEATDAVPRITELSVSLPADVGWPATGEARVLAPGTDDRSISWTLDGGRLRLTVPQLDSWAVVVISL